MFGKVQGEANGSANVASPFKKVDVKETERWYIVTVARCSKGVRHEDG